MRSDAKVEIGSRVNLHFTILAEDIETITGVGEVVRIQDDPPGLGVEFRSISEESMELIEALIAKGGHES